MGCSASMSVSPPGNFETGRALMCMQSFWLAALDKLSWKMHDCRPDVCCRVWFSIVSPDILCKQQLRVCLAPSSQSAQLSFLGGPRTQSGKVCLSEAGFGGVSTCTNSMASGPFWYLGEKMLPPLGAGRPNSLRQCLATFLLEGCQKRAPFLGHGVCGARLPQGPHRMMTILRQKKG